MAGVKPHEELVQTKRSFQDPNVPRRMWVFKFLHDGCMPAEDKLKVFSVNCMNANFLVR